MGIQAYKLLTGLYKTGNYDIVEIAGSLTKIDPPVSFFEGIKLYNTADGYGNPNMLRQILQTEHPDIILAFSDPRFFEYMFSIDDEIRPLTKIVLYHTWDNEPFPSFNLPFYAACDKIVMLSRFSYDLMKSGGVNCSFIPHGFNSEEFFPIPEEVRRETRNRVLEPLIRGGMNPNFVLLWNNRNIARKRPGTIIEAFSRFIEIHPDSALILNSDVIDKEGTDFHRLIEHFGIEVRRRVIFNPKRISTSELNNLYNIADVTLNLSFNEGFGLSTSESLLAGTPSIVTKTGGLIDQVEDSTGTKYGLTIEPKVRDLFGVITQPFIYRDFVSTEDVVEALNFAYDENLQGNWKRKGLEGRKYIMEKFPEAKTIELWDTLLKEVHSNPSIFKRERISVH